jgi:hypothetical protein
LNPARRWGNVSTGCCNPHLRLFGHNLSTVLELDVLVAYGAAS